MTVRGFADIEPLVYDCTKEFLSPNHPLDIDKPVVIDGNGSGYLRDWGGFQLLCDRVENCFRQKSATPASPKQNDFTLDDPWRHDHLDDKVGTFISEASAEAERQQPKSAPANVG